MLSTLTPLIDWQMLQLVHLSKAMVLFTFTTAPGVELTLHTNRFVFRPIQSFPPTNLTQNGVKSVCPVLVSAI